MSTPTIGSFVKTDEGTFGYFAGVTGSRYVIELEDGNARGFMPQQVTVTHTPGFIADGERGILYFDTIEAARAYGVAVPAMIPVGADVEDRFPECMVCDEQVEDAGDHADNAGHWPWQERIYLTEEARDAAQN